MQGGDWSDMFSLMKAEFRPGHWGVFHLAHFTIGAGGAVTTEDLQERCPCKTSFPGCGSFTNPLSPRGEPTCPMRVPTIGEAG